MSSYYKYAQFTYCTPLSDFQSGSYETTLNWLLPETDIYRYDKIEIKRFIGRYMEEVTTTPVASSVLFFTAEQQVDPITDGYNGQIITTYDYPPTQTISTLNINLTSLDTATDNLNVYDNTNSNLKTLHTNLATDTYAIDDQTILSQIATGKRVIWYSIITYVKGAFNRVPFMLSSHYDTGIVDNTSTKTLVTQDILHFEGDLVWLTKLSPWNSSYRISRTAVDTVVDPLKPSRGGNVWIAERLNGYVYKCNLLNGLQTGKYQNTYQKYDRGHGVCVQIGLHNCFSGSTFGPNGNTSGPWTNKIIRCDDTAIPSDDQTNGISTLIATLPNSYGYGVYGLTNTTANTDYVGVTPNGQVMYVLNLKNGSQVLTGAYTSYSITAGSDGSIFGSTSSAGSIPTSSKLTIFKINPAGTITTDSIDTLIRSFCLTVDNYTLWPNTANSPKKYHLLLNGNADYLSDPINYPDTHGAIEDCVIDGNNLVTEMIVASSTFYAHASTGNAADPVYYSYRGIGVDGENNLWTPTDFQSNIWIKSKIYRVSGGSDFPYQGNCRYPTIPLTEQPFSTTNSPIIEWFLTRDSGYRNTTMGVTEHSPTMSLAAENAWWALVEDKRFEVNPTYCGEETIGYRILTENNTTSHYTTSYGIRMKDYETDYQGCLTDIETWYNTYNTPLLSADTFIGRRVMPWYGTPDAVILAAFQNNGVIYFQNGYTPDWYEQPNPALRQPSYTIVFKHWSGQMYQYSDFTGNVLIGSEDSTLVSYDNIYPTLTFNTQILSEISAVHNNDGYQETKPACYPWENIVSYPKSVGFPSTNTVLTSSVSGYDNLTVYYRITANLLNTTLTSIVYNSDDFNSTDYILPNDGLNVYTGSYIYKEPSRIGIEYLPSGYATCSCEYFMDRKLDGVFAATVNLSAYNLYTGYSSVVSGLIYNATVLERWPEPRTYLEPTDSTLTRTNTFCNSSWGLTRFDRSADLRKESNSTDAMRYDITYGVDPIHVEFKDRSIARTYPISSWHLTLSTNNTFISWYPTQTMIIASNPSLSVLADTQNYYDVITGFDLRFGNYKIIMNVAASSTATFSDKDFVNYIEVAELEPFANFWAATGYTVPSNYTADNPTLATLIGSPFPNGNYPLYPFVSGYAPKFTVYFQDSSDAHTFPISQYNWNFGDYYNEGSSNVTEISSNYYTICSNNISVTGNFNLGCWRTNYVAHTAQHTYTMPGTYDVTLTVTASVTNTMDTCAKYLDVVNNIDRFYVYVEEIPPIFTGGISGSNSLSGSFSDILPLTGLSPQTFYFVASNILAGSFPICKMMWDFGDGTVETILRSPSAASTTQGLSLVYHTDPRYTIVPHTYTNETASDTTYEISVSAYACNTNTMISLNNDFMVGPISNAYTEQIEDRQLIGSTFDTNGNLIYIFEGLTTHNTYTMVMSGDA